MIMLGYKLFSWIRLDSAQSNGMSLAGIERLALIYGYSMGAMQALHWGVMFPDRVARIAAICGSAKVRDYNVVFLDSLKNALECDPDIRKTKQAVAS